MCAVKKEWTRLRNLFALGKRIHKEFALVGSVLDKNLVSDYFSNIPILANICPCYLMSVFFIRIWYKIQIFWYWKSSQTCSSCWPEMILRRFKIQERFSRYCISYESKDTALKKLPTNRLVWRNSAWGRICHSNIQKVKNSKIQKVKAFLTHCTEKAPNQQKLCMMQNLQFKMSNWIKSVSIQVSCEWGRDLRYNCKICHPSWGQSFCQIWFPRAAGN